MAEVYWGSPVYPLDRTEPAGQDLAWLPSHLRALRLGTTAALWSGTALAATAAALFSGGALLHFALVLGAGGLVASERLARAMSMQRLRKLARGDVDLARLSHQADGELVHVRGRVSARTTLPGFLHGTPAVYRRMTFRLAGARLVHHAAVDFDLIDDTQQPVTIEVAGARLLAPELESAEYPAARFHSQPLTPSLARVMATRMPSSPVDASEILLRDGDLVEVVGYKSRTVDPRVQSRLERDTPMRATLRTGRDLPLLISPLGRRAESEI
jgi:hypothetical protein